MIYAKWKLLFTADGKYGEAPTSVVVTRGDSIEGAFFVGAPQDWIYGYLNDGFDYTGLEAWQVTEVTQAEILEKAQERNPECYIDDNGKVAAPEPEQP